MSLADSLIVLLMLVAFFWTFSLHTVRPALAKQTPRQRIRNVLIEGAVWITVWIGGQMLFDKFTFEQSLPRALVAGAAWIGISYYVRTHYYRLAQQDADSFRL
jgi:hypothetical protein